MTTTNTATTTVKAVKFSWTDETTAIVVDAYKAKLEAAGHEVASSNEHLLELAGLVGAASEKSIRGKLSREGVYVKLDKPASQAKSNKIRKEHIVRAIANTLLMQNGDDDIDSLKNGKQDHLQELADKLGVTNIMEAASKDYSPRPELVIANFMRSMSVDWEDMEIYFEELKEAEQTAE